MELIVNLKRWKFQIVFSIHRENYEFKVQIQVTKMWFIRILDVEHEEIAVSSFRQQNCVKFVLESISPNSRTWVVLRAGERPIRNVN